MKRRGVIAAAILFAWVAGLGMLVQREYFRPHIERLAEAALRVSPAAIFYAVLQGDDQVGFASSTIDTTTSSIEQRDYLVAEVPTDGRTRRLEMRTNVSLTRTLRLRSFESLVEEAGNSRRVTGTVEGDSVLVLETRQGTAAPETRRMPLTSGILLPALVPLAVALDERPSIGKSYLLPVLDPRSLQSADVRVAVRAESLFVVNDSSVFDSTSSRWVGTLADTVRAWEIVDPDTTLLSGWVDERGRLVRARQRGFVLERRPYEVAFENWRREVDTTRGMRPVVAAPPSAKDSDVVPTTLLAAGRRPTGSVATMRVLVRGRITFDLSLLEGRQRLRIDTIVVQRADSASLEPRYNRINIDAERNRHLREEQFLEVKHPEIVALAERLAGDEPRPRPVIERIFAWVRDSVASTAPSGIPSALQVLHERRADASGKAQLFVALARAAGVPARVVTGFMHADGKLYLHAWADVMMRGWVPVDPTLGQLPADASHLRVLYGGAGRESELIARIGNLKFDVLSAR